MSTAEIGIIGGSGLYDMAGLEDREELRLTTPYGDPSDGIVVGTLAGRRIAFLARHGRGHRLTPSEVPSRANIYALKALGVNRVIGVSAVGSLREELAPGHFVVPDQIIDRTKGIRPASFFGDGLVVHVPFAHPYCDDLRVHVLDAARKGSSTTVHDGGTYCCMEGPQFSTRAESELYRSWGLHLIGMTVLPEAKLAREAELCYATLALVTDYDCWHPDHDSVTAAMVIETLQRNALAAQATIAALIAALPRERGCGCASALAHAIMTSPDMVPPATRERTRLLVGNYMGW